MYVNCGGKLKARSFATVPLIRKKNPYSEDWLKTGQIFENFLTMFTEMFPAQKLRIFLRQTKYNIYDFSMSLIKETFILQNQTVIKRENKFFLFSL